MSAYLIVVQAAAYPVRPGVFATESAFGEHLRMLKEKVSGRFDKMLLAAPQLTEAEYEAQKATLAHIDEQEEGIEFVPLHRVDRGKLGFWRKDARKAWRNLRRAVEEAGVVHSGIADDLWRPTMLFANVAGRLARRPVLFLVDIDFRNDTDMFFETGVWGKRTYWLNKLVYDPVKLAQVHLAPFLFDLVLFKSGRMVREVGHGRPNVRNFFDTAHSAEHVIDDDALKTRLDRLADRSQPLKCVFFGRFIGYKGLDRSIRAVHLARQKSGRDLQLTLIGMGDDRAELEALVDKLEARDAVRFVDPLPYGPKLFAEVAQHDVQLATPLVEDTPRAAFDAFAQGMPIAAFGINYYKDLEEQSGAVVTARWPDPSALAEQLVVLDQDRKRLTQMAEAAVRFARENTQEIWLERRIDWTFEVVDARR